MPPVPPAAPVPPPNPSDREMRQLVKKLTRDYRAAGMNREEAKAKAEHKARKKLNKPYEEWERNLRRS